MIQAVADTHTVIWYLFDDPRLSAAARAVMAAAAASGDHVAFSSITLAEIVYLAERDRIADRTLDRLLAALDGGDAVLQEVPFDRSVACAMVTVSREQVAELPDRIIAATAHYLGVPVISRDAAIRASHVPTIW